MEFKHTAIIATRNRKDDLRRTLRQLAALDPPPGEILVCCDGCTDGTSAMLAAEFPEVVRLVNDAAIGSVGSRRRLMAAAGGDIVLSFDDDSYPVEPAFIRRVERLFAERPRLGIASFPQRTDEFPETLSADDFGPSLYVASYAASAAAFRREAYARVPGWDPVFQHAYEEPDLALQMTAAGWMVYHYTGLTVRHHYSSANRREVRIHHRHARNEQWSIWMRCPFPQLIALSLYRLIRQLVYAASRGPGWLAREPAWWLQAFRGAAHCLRARRPVPWRVYLGWMRLFKHPLTSEKEWRSRFLP